MNYTLPRVGKELNECVDRWYKNSSHYREKLIAYYRNKNPIALIPLGNVPKEILSHTTYAILSTLRKLNKQAHLEGKNLPILPIIEDGLGIFVADSIEAGLHETSLEVARRCFHENKYLWNSIRKYVLSLEDTLKDNVFMPFLYTLMLLERQGKLNETISL